MLPAVSTPIALLLPLGAALLAAPAAAADLLVPSQYATVQAALDAASPGDRVLVAAGTYPVANLDFGGKAIELAGAGADQTTLDGQSSARVFVFDDGETAGAVVRDLSVANGVAPDGTPGTPGGPSMNGGDGGDGEDGGGVSILSASPTFERVAFADNRAGDGGAGGQGFGWTGGGGSIVGRNGGTGGDGGHGSPGQTTGDDGERGGDGWFAGNGGHGGALHVLSGTAQVINGVLLDNRAGNGGAGGQGGDGGDGRDGVGNGGDGGDAGSGGGGGDGGDGGGLHSPGGASTLLHGAVASNARGERGLGGQPGTPGEGGEGGFIGVDGQDGSPGFPGGDGVFGNGGGVGNASTGLTVRNSILSANLGSDVAPGAVVTYSCLGAAYPGAGNIAANPLFLDLPNGDVRLQGGSPCVDTGDPNTTGLPPFDFEGEPRVQGPGVDIGPDETFAMPGSGEDLTLTTWIDGAGDPLGVVKTATAGASWTLDLETPGGTFVGGVALVGVQAYATSGMLGFDPFYAGLHLNTAVPGLVSFVVGGATPFGPAGLGPDGVSLAYTIPTGLAGSTLRWQSLVLSAAATNGVYATTNAVDVRIQ